MKKSLLVVTSLLLVLAVISVGCASKAPAAPTTPPSVAQGPLTGVTTQPPSVTVETPKGPTQFPIGPNAELTLNGQACTIADLDQLEASGQPYNCVVVYDEQGNAIAANVTKLPTPASVTGTISDVNTQQSTITVKTAEGDKVYQVDPNTGVIIGGTACSLELISALVETGAELPCTIIYSVDNQGVATYIDIANPPDLTQGSGTLTNVNPAESTVTIQTDKGPRTFAIDPQTGAFLNGAVCSLADIEAFGETGANLPCQVLYYLDSDGNLVYIDIAP